MPIRVLIADDDPLVREGLQVILDRDPDFSVVAVAGDGREAIERCESREIDIALLDARMPVIDGPSACEAITRDYAVRCCILSTFRDEELVSRSIHAGAKGYLLKGAGGDEIKQALRLIRSGNSVFQSSVFDSVRQGGRYKPDLSMLTEREREVVGAVARGLSNKEISEELFLSEGTVKNYLSSILSKLDLRQRTQIAVYYLGGSQSDTN
jgi:DNA-binding NarL/FixJ family response regulator